MRRRFRHVSCAILASLSSLALAQAPEGWTQTEGPNGTIFTHKSNAAMIMIGQVPLDKAQNPQPSAGAMDKPGGCVGISKVPLETVMNGRARRLRSNSPTLTCNLYFAAQNGKGVMVIAMEQSTANAHAATVAETLLGQRLGPQPIHTPPAQATVAASSGTARPSVTPPRPTGGPARASDPAGLVGMWRSDWVENRYDGINGLVLMAVDETLIFTSGGYFFDGVPENVSLDDGGAQEIMRKDPAQAGRYSVSTGLVTLTYGNGKRETVRTAKRGQTWELEFRNRNMQPKMTFMSGGYLSGNYSTTRISQAGSTFVVGEDDYSFAPDGRFAKGGSVSLSSAAVSSIGGRGVRTGRYVIKSSGLILSYDDGTREVYSMFQETAGKEIWLNDQMYRLYQPE
jgi:hypothetical protein